MASFFMFYILSGILLTKLQVLIVIMFLERLNGFACGIILVSVINSCSSTSRLFRRNLLFCLHRFI